MDLNTLKQRAQAFDYLFDSVVLTDPQGIIIDWNKGSEALYGYTKEEVLGRSVGILHVPEDDAHITSEVISTIKECGRWTGEIRMLHKDGHIGWVESVCVPLFNNDNQLIGALGINRDITNRIKESKRLEYLAYYDQLTEVPNRHLLLDRIKHLIAQCKRNHLKFSLLYIDLDKFKNINDTKGHAFGDHILKEVASRIAQSIRNSDTFARIGGDEFVLLAENTSDKKTVSRIAQHIIDVIGKTFSVNGELFEITCSIGIAIYPDDGNNVDELLAASDKAMYKAKHTYKTGELQFFSLINQENNTLPEVTYHDA